MQNRPYMPAIFCSAVGLHNILYEIWDFEKRALRTVALIASEVTLRIQILRSGHLCSVDTELLPHSSDGGLKFLPCRYAVRKAECSIITIHKIIHKIRK